MNYADIFNERTVNIFCDGSIKTNPITKETIGCPGCCVVMVDHFGNESIIDQPRFIMRDCTNNMTENRSLLLAIYCAMTWSYAGYDVNIFGDSQYCIFGVTNWIFSWVNNVYNGHMYNSSGNIVKNEDMIKELIATIYNNKLEVNLYHQKGHVTNSPQSQNKASDCFRKSNGVNIVDPILIQRISYYNDIVDVFTKVELENFSATEEYNNIFSREKFVVPASFDISGIDMNIYKEQIKRRKRYV